MNTNAKAKTINCDSDIQEDLMLAIEQCDERIKELSSKSCMEVWIHGSDRVAEAVIEHYRNASVQVEYLYAPAKDRRSLLITSI